MERREAPGAQRRTLADHDAARRAVATARTPVTQGCGASRRSTATLGGRTTFFPHPRASLPIHPATEATVPKQIRLMSMLSLATLRVN